MAVVSPDRKFFAYFAPADGLYWFNTMVVGTDGKSEPPDITEDATTVEGCGRHGEPCRASSRLPKGKGTGSICGGKFRKRIPT